VGPAVNLPSILSGDLLVVNEFTASSGLVDSVYVRSNLPVTPVQNAFTAGQRAGAAACAVAELGTIDPVDGVPIDTMLAGDWTVCSGEFLEGYRRLRFDQHARSLAFVDEAGVAQPSKPFKLVHSDTVPPSNPRDTTLVFEEQPGGADTWSIMFSERPHKMWVLASSQHAVQRELVLSALAP
jgi:hypothetical protein